MPRRRRALGSGLVGPVLRPRLGHAGIREWNGHRTVDATYLARALVPFRETGSGTVDQGLKRLKFFNVRPPKIGPAIPACFVDFLP